MKDLNKEGAGLIRAWQTHLHASNTPQQEIKETPKPVVETPREYSVLLVGFSGICYALTIHQVLKCRQPNIGFTAADNVTQAQELLTQGYHTGQNYDLVIIAEGVEKPSYVGVVTDQLRSRSMCGEVFVFSPVDELQARKLGMIPINNIEQLVYHLRPKEVRPNSGRITPQEPSTQLTHIEPQNIEGILAAIQTRLIIK